MLNIIKSGFGGSGERHIKDMIAARVAKREKCYLIVPEQQTVMAESEMAMSLPSYAPLCFEVTNFKRFQNTVFRSLGGLAGEFCDSGKQTLIMWRTLTELSPMLSIMGQAEVSAGLVSQALAAVGEMENLSITPEELSESSEKINGNDRLCAKVKDLSAIYSMYRSLLSEKYTDDSRADAIMLEKLRENPDFLTDTKIYLIGFTSFTEGQYRLIGALSKRVDVTLHLPIPKLDGERFEYLEICRAESKLKLCARREGADVKVSAEDGNVITSSELLSMLPSKIWQLNPQIDNSCLQNPDELRIFEASSPFDECDFVASDIRRRVMGGAKYSDFAIIARSAEKYSGIIDGALSSADVPYFYSIRRDVMSFEAVKLILTAYLAVCHGYRREDIITYAKCGLHGISREDIDELELYSEVWQINGSTWTSGEIWNMNPAGYTSRKAPDTDEKLMRINRTKDRLITPLIEFEKDVKRAKTVRESAEALMILLLAIGLEDTLNARAEEEMKLGNKALSDELSGVWRLIIDSLDSMVEVLGDLPTTPEAFTSQLRAVLSTANLGKIPAYTDQVTVGSADMLRLSGKKHVYLIGVNQGEFPSDVSDTSYFSDKDRELLAEGGLDITPELETQNARELFCFSRALSSASESVTLLYSVCDTKFKRIEPSNVIEKITKMTGGRIAPRRIIDMPIKDRFYSAHSALNSIDTVSPDEYEPLRRALISSGFDGELCICDSDIKNTSLDLTKDVADKLYGDRIALTQSRIDSYVDCPLKYLLKYTLKLQTVAPAEFDASGIGSFIHGCLENFFRTVTDNGQDPSQLSEGERCELVRLSASKYLSDMGENITAPRTKAKISRLTRSAIPIVSGLCDELSKTDFRPRFFELRIDLATEDTPTPTTYTAPDGTKIYLYGIIDRVDTMERDGDVYVKVIDYKTGSKDFSPDDIKKGRNLQMFIYLNAIINSKNADFRKRLGVENGGNIIPAAAVYVKASLSDATAEKNDDALIDTAQKSKQQRDGMALGEEENLASLGAEYIPGAHKRDNKKFLYTREGFADIMQDVEDSVIRIAEEIKSGKAASAPAVEGSKTPCKYCDYQSVCRNAVLK